MDTTGDISMVDHSPIERESLTDDTGSVQSLVGAHSSSSGPGKVDRYARVNERLERSWGNATGWAPPADTYKFTIDDLNRAGINLRDNVSRVTAKAQKNGYRPLGRLWQPQGLFYELALETGMMRKSEDGRIVVQAKLFHRAAALADEWFAGELRFVKQEDGSQIVVRKSGMGEEVGGREEAGGRGGDEDRGVSAQHTQASFTRMSDARQEGYSSAASASARKNWDGNGDGDGDDEEMLDVDGSGKKRTISEAAARPDKPRQIHRLRTGWDDASDQRRIDAAAPTTTTTLGAAAKSQHRTPLPTAGGSRRSSSAATPSEATVGRQPATTKSWTSINRPARAPAPALAPTQTTAHSYHDAPPVRNPNTTTTTSSLLSSLSSSSSSSLKRHRPEHDDDDDARDNDDDDDADADADAATPSDLKKRRQLRRPEREQRPPLFEEYLRDEFDLEKLRWALDLVREAADVVVQRGGEAVYSPPTHQGQGQEQGQSREEAAAEYAERARMHVCLMLLTGASPSDGGRGASGGSGGSGGGLT